MVDLVYQRSGEGEVEVSASVEQLRRYSIATARYFAEGSLDAGALLKHLSRDTLS